MVQLYTPGLTLILGPMWSGKTTELLRIVKTYRVAKRKVLVIRRPHLHRDGIDKPGKIAARDTSDDMDCVEMDNLVDNLTDSSYDVYAIDEGQFQVNLAAFCRKAIFEWRKLVVVAMLSGNFRQEPLKASTLSLHSNVEDLVPLATKIQLLEAVCMVCRNNVAYYTYRTYRTQVTDSSSDTVCVGDKDIYESICIHCLSDKLESDELDSDKLNKVDEK